MTKTERERSLAVFIDLENLAMGFQNQRKIRFEVQKVLERLVEKGKLIVKKAYADWSRYPSYTAPFHEAAIELIEIPKRSQTGKNSADIRLVVDAMDLAWSKAHVDTFVIVSGDSDFSPLVSKLKENGKHVIGLGMKGSTSDLLRDNCDEFIYYEDLERQEQNEQQLATDLELVLAPQLARAPARALQPVDRGLQRAPARKPRGDLRLDDQGHDETKEAVVRRELLRLSQLHPLARGRRQPGAGGYRAKPEERHVRRHRFQRRARPKGPSRRSRRHQQYCGTPRCRPERQTRHPARPRGSSPPPPLKSTLHRESKDRFRLQQLAERDLAGETTMFFDPSCQQLGSELRLVGNRPAPHQFLMPAVVLAMLSVFSSGIHASAADGPENETLKKHKLKAAGSLEVLEDEALFKTKLADARRLLRQLSYSILQQQGTMSPEQYQTDRRGTER